MGEGTHAPKFAPMRQSAPWPVELDDLVKRAQALTGWEFRLDSGEWDDGQVSGLRLIITVQHHDSYHPERRRSTQFHYQVPCAVYDRASWQRWIFDRCMDHWRHEMGEALGFRYVRPDENGTARTVIERPFAPFHGPGRDPNRNVEVGVDTLEARIPQDEVSRYAPDRLYQGERYPGWWWNGDYLHDDVTHDGCILDGTSRACTPCQLLEDTDETGA